MKDRFMKNDVFSLEYDKETLREMVLELQEENKLLRENAEHSDKVVDKVNWENMMLKKKNKQLKDNWNELKDWLSEQPIFDYFSPADIKIKIQELEGSNN